MTNEAWIALALLAITVIGGLVTTVWNAAKAHTKNETQDTIMRDHENRIRSLEGKKSQYKRDSDTIKFPEDPGAAS